MTNQAGKTSPLGATKVQGGFNFAIYSEAPVLELVIAPFYNKNDITHIPLDTKINKSGSIWHLFYPTSEQSLYYAYIVDHKGKSIWAVDPYAKLLDTRNGWDHKPLGLVFEDSNFDWTGETKPDISARDLIIYEMHLLGFTRHSSSKVDTPGTFAGLIKKIPYLKELGINAVEFLPLHEFDKTDNYRKNPKTGKKLCDYWGYSPLSFFSFMQRYASSENPLAALHEFKEMIKALHKAGIEVIVDMVFNHTGEGNEQGRTLSWKAFAESTYYLKDSRGHFLNYSGCGNTVNCNHPIVSEMIISALRYWVTELHIDGIRFDLASILTRGQDGAVMPSAPLIERITQDPVLSHCTLIAEPWDAAGLHQVGSFYQTPWGGPESWMEWNDDYRSVVRSFIKGTSGYAGRFATKLCGSQDIYGKGGTPLNSINYITSHDGFTLRDLVSYDYKHNIENGEDNRDGMNNNDSWNCGKEGDTNDSHIELLRQRQMKNFCLALFCSAGVPMIHMGDEYGHTKHGNNNSWCQDNELNWFLWNEIEKSASFHRFFEKLIAFRKSSDALRRTTFYAPGEIVWHGQKPYHPNWSDHSRFVAFTTGNLYIAFSASHETIDIDLPDDNEWHVVINTASPPPLDFVEPHVGHTKAVKHIKMAPHAAVLLISS